MSSTQSPTFTYFRRFPAEIQLEILKQCSRNDIVCFSLTSHDFQTLTKPLLTSKPHLEWVDQLGSTADIPNTCRFESRTGCNGLRGKELMYSSRMHRYNRHSIKMDRGGCYSCQRYPKDHPECKVAYCKKHCLCISCPLFVRLRGWMGDRRYCSTCHKFTARKKKNNGRCTHGVPKVRKAPNNHWSHKKGLSYGRRWWRKWGTCNIDHEAYTADASRRFNARVV